ncbi:MAG TPA: heavy metal-binding domain-containing protein [Bacteroidia bacterium]|nr:heavy metal-binding domain-containing protein [Bacteroidia bacterium]
MLCFILITVHASYGQGCCSGGSGSPIAGGASQGVLQDRQVEINTNYQYINTNKFFTADHKDTATFFDSFESQYLYTRVGYGITKDFTMSVESGYWLKKTQIGLDNSDTVSSSGIGDLILFPRYDVINRTGENKRVELTIGLGIKIPLGSYNDSVGRIEPFSGTIYYITKPLSVQTSTGSNDVIFYSFFSRGYPNQQVKLFANAIYIKKGWNAIGEKMGDYASVGLFAGKTFTNKLGITLQVKGEWVDKMKLNNTVLLYNYPNYDPFATGSRKIFVVPQLSYSFKNFTVYALSEIPVYQWVVNTQVGSQYQFTAGLSYRFLTYKPGKVNESQTSDGAAQPSGAFYQCSMKCEGKKFDKPGKCPICGMEMELVK